MLLLWVSTASAAEAPYIGYSNYQIVTDMSFDAGPYFRAMQQAGVNLQRIWVGGYGHAEQGFRETMPFTRHGRKYDLHSIDKRYLRRLREVMDLAAGNGQRVLLTLFDRWQMANADRYVKTPWYYKNNTTRYLKNPLPDFFRTDRQEWVAIQENYVRAIVRATREHRPIYEIMNEARLPGDCAALAKWHRLAASWILDEAPDAEIAINTLDDCPALFEIPEADWIALHYDAWSAGICDAAQRYKSYGKHIMIDTDGAFLHRGDNRLLRSWLQESLECGLSFNHKDDIYNLDTEALKIISEFQSGKRE